MPKVFRCRLLASLILFVPGRSRAERPALPKQSIEGRSYEPTPLDSVAGRGSRRSPRCSASENGLPEKALDARHPPGLLIPSRHGPLERGETSLLIADATALSR